MSGEGTDLKRKHEERLLYKQNKELMYRRDGWKCRCCGRRDGLTPHHVIFQGKGGTDELNNLLTICVECHNGIHTKKILLEVVEKTLTDLVVKFWRKV